MKIYCTKYALTMGIIVLENAVENGNYWAQGMYFLRDGKDGFMVKADAERRACEMAEKAIALAETKIEKLHRLAKTPKYRAEKPRG